MKALLVIFSSILVSSYALHSPNVDGRRAAEEILSSLDQAFITRNYQRFFNLHSPNFKLRLCKLKGGKDTLLKYLEHNRLVTHVKKSKHTIVKSPVPNGTIKFDGSNYSFKYEEHLLLDDDQLYQTTGVIRFQINANRIEIVSADELCPVKVF